MTAHYDHKGAANKDVIALLLPTNENVQPCFVVQPNMLGSGLTAMNASTICKSKKLLKSQFVY